MVDVQALASDIVAQHRARLAQAITLIESVRETDRKQALQLFDALLPIGHMSHRIAFTGTPGAGKSTVINALARRWLAAQKKVAVLCIDPTSTQSGGSILGDKTRMGDVLAHERAFVRASPSRLHHGGVAAWTHEAMLLCEAAQFDVICVETVGVGQGETDVFDMVDTSVLLMTPGGGDDVQGIKKGILEMANMVLMNKADGTLKERAYNERTTLLQSLKLARPGMNASDVLVMSAWEDALCDDVVRRLNARYDGLRASGDIERIREEQRERMVYASMRVHVIHVLERCIMQKKTEYAQEINAVKKGQRLPESLAIEWVRGLLSSK